MLEKLDRTMRLKLLRVLAAAAWVDGDVQESERAFLTKILAKLPIDDAERATAMGYLDTPPHPAEVDPTKIPAEHREELVRLVWQLIGSDGKVEDAEMQAVKELEELLLP